MGEGFQLLRIRGIPLRIHPSWFVILALATWGFQKQYGQQELLGPGSPASEPLSWLLALATALLLFLSVLLHELGHSFAAIAQGVKVRSITLFLLGGVASIERESTTARGALIVAAAGPLVSLLLAAGLIGASHGATHLWPPLGVLVSQLGELNLVLGLFNLLPGLPLDGGLILKALVWQWTGSQRRGGNSPPRRAAKGSPTAAGTPPGATTTQPRARPGGPTRPPEGWLRSPSPAGPGAPERRSEPARRPGPDRPWAPEATCELVWKSAAMATLDSALDSAMDCN